MEEGAVRIETKIAVRDGKDQNSNRVKRRSAQGSSKSDALVQRATALCAADRVTRCDRKRETQCAERLKAQYATSEH